MTPAAFRKLALSMFAAEEGSHMGHADFRVRAKIFATLPPRPRGWDEDAAMVKLTPDQQRVFVSGNRQVFEPVPGGWGAKGATYVRLKNARSADVKQALDAAWHNNCGREIRTAAAEFAGKARAPVAMSKTNKSP